MPSYQRPGVYFEETIAQAEAITSTSLSAGGFLGANSRGPLSPILVQSWTQYLTHFGGFGGPTEYLPYAVFEFFANGGRDAYVARVAGSGAAVADKDLNDRAGTPAPTLTIAAANPGTWGNSIYIDILDAGDESFHLVVKLGGAGDSYIVERWLDLDMDPNSGRYAPALVNATSGGSPYIVVTDLASATVAPANRPAAQTGTALAGGSDGAAVTSSDIGAAVTVFDVVERPLSLNLPGESGGGVGAALTYAANRGDVFLVIDPPMGNDVDTVLNSYVSGLAASSFGGVYYPWVQVADPASSAPGAARLIPPGGAVIGQFASTDATRGVFKTPAGINTRIAGAVGVERRLTGAELDQLNMANVNAIRHLPGAGVVIMGGRTLKMSGSDKYVSVRRTLIYIRASLIQSTRFAIFEPNDERLWLTLRSIIERFLLDLWQRGGLRGESAAQAFFVKCDDDLNTPQAIASGEVKVQIGVALQYPAEFVVFSLSQREVGATVTVEL
ncbi:MAG TPA: phage tail sheath subtilisin-like domain-containing protein [Gemmatimonadales bacterium]|nr:phage tail sheath subtilisin-like domain-containing protein [Gemmatimonadales bacterium]